MRRRFRPRRVAAVMAALAAVGVGLATPAAWASARPPAVAPGGAVTRSAPSSSAAHPGDLLSHTRLRLKTFPGLDAWRITYRSMDANGKPDVVSGAVIAPPKATAATPIVAYAPGTWGLGDQCAPSRHLDSDSYAESEQAYIKKYTDLGYAVAMTDYEGLGTAGKHTYNVGPSEGHAVLDSVRAARSLPGAGLTSKAPVAVVGYSQGGFATGWAAELAPRYAPEVRLIGAALGGPPANLGVNLRFVDGTKYAGEYLMAIYGLDAAYPNLHLERYLNAKGRAAFKEVATECVGDIVVSPDPNKTVKWAGHRFSEYTTSNFLKRADWRAAIHKSLMGTRTPRIPVLLYNSPDDDIVPFGPAAHLRRIWVKQGADVTFYAPQTGGHGITSVLMAPVVTGWITARMLGLPTQ